MPEILTWNLFHGRARPPAGRELFDAFATAIAGWRWDVALLQEVPPWWPRPLAERAEASMRMALTSRNALLPLRRLVATAAPDLVKSNGGGCNAILVRGARVTRHEQVELTRTPERRVAHAVRLDDGAWVMNLHASKQEPTRARTDADVRRAQTALDIWAAGAPRLVLGGDLNVADPPVRDMTLAARHGVDSIWVRGFAPAARGRTLDAGRLSDHRPVLAAVQPL